MGLSWLASMEVLSDDGRWDIISALFSIREHAYEWIRFESQKRACARIRRWKVIRYHHRPAKPTRYREDQFSWCQGEECANDWQQS